MRFVGSDLSCFFRILTKPVCCAAKCSTGGTAEGERVTALHEMASVHEHCASERASVSARVRARAASACARACQRAR
eukprot:1641561-Pleurochrysis_carterae.AAC.1